VLGKLQILVEASSIKCKAYGCEKEFDKAVVTWVHQQYLR
jgi:hypothetical protein